jgi:hypothetical protein
MRDVFMGLAVLAALAPAAARAEEPCPQRVNAEFEASLGEVAATLGGGQSIYTPAGLRMLDQPVSYVLVIRQGEEATSAITELDYRLQGVNRPYGERYPESLRKAFDAGFDTDCGTGRNSSCVVSVRSTQVGELTGAELGQGNVTIGADASGAGLALAEADYDLDGVDPVFLVCLYRAPE